MDKPLEDNRDAIIGLRNPYSKITCLILYLYSMELGTPSLYADANRVARELDQSYVKELGPYLRVLGKITLASERNK